MVNRTLGNRYQITEKIGMGGMAEVYKATDSTLGRTVAVKVMLPQYASDPNFAARGSGGRKPEQPVYRQHLRLGP